ncbi:hypothetical protein ACOBQX_16240 [Actinokineospora sp. G85]|uniref:hypothetical protein n=1 Tax=Actinokineospora sp. G85 TaxID=3406626 RepID=UPI003C75DD88
METASTWRARRGSVEAAPLPRAVAGVAATGLITLSFSLFLAVAGLSTERTDGLGFDHAPGWLLVVAAVAIAAGALGLLASAVRRAPLFALDDKGLRAVLLGGAPVVATWADVEDAAAVDGRLVVSLRSGAVLDLAARDARRDAAVLRHFARAGVAPTADEANRVWSSTAP